jgi:mannose-1-phosphate guanylyltransferase
MSIDRELTSHLGALQARRIARHRKPQAMLLAAGLGTRLWPLTCDRAKPAVPFLGKPLIAGLIDLLARHGFDRAVVNTHHLPESIARALAETPHNVDVRLSHEPEILGTAGALAKALASGALDPARPTIVINAKLYTDIDLGRVAEAHAASGALVTMVLKPNVEREHFREVLVEGDRIVGFGAGRVPEGPNPLLFTGIHVLEPEVVATIPLAFSDTVQDVYPPLIRDRRVAAHIDHDGRWWEFSTLARYHSLHVRAAEEGFGADVSLSEGARVSPRAIAHRAVLWENASIEDGAVVEDAVLGSDVVIPRGAIVRSAVVVRRDRVDDADRGTPLFSEYLQVPLGNG